MASTESLSGPTIFPLRDTVEFKSAVERIYTAVEAAGKISIMYTTNPEEVPEYFHRGFQAVTLGTDIKLMVSQLRSLIGQIKSDI